MMNSCSNKYFLFDFDHHHQRQVLTKLQNKSRARLGARHFGAGHLGTGTIGRQNFFFRLVFLKLRCFGW